VPAASASQRHSGGSAGKRSIYEQSEKSFYRFHFNQLTLLMSFSAFAESTDSSEKESLTCQWMISM
jgi:hypothetical protein